MRILGIDYGEKRIGRAVSDPLGMMAHQLEIITVKSDEDAIAQLRKIAEEREADRLVVGLPINMNGTEGPQALAAREFAEKLKNALGLPVEMQDERLTTGRAERAMLDADMTRKRRGLRRDRMAAQFLLQTYLDIHRLKD